MILLALKMLIGNRTSCLGVIFGIFLATLLVSQQSAIFLGLVTRSYRMITDIPAPNIWVTDPATESDDRVRSMPEGYIDIVRSTPGVEWAVPISRANVSLVTPSGTFEVCKLYGIDDATLIGAPLEMLEGNVKDLHREGAVIVDTYSANGSLAISMNNGKKRPLKMGDEIEINNRRAVVVGICKVTRGFYPQPILFSSFSQFNYFTPTMSHLIEFIAVKTHPHIDVEKVRQKINAHPNLNALTKKQFETKIIESFLKTGILINFGLSVALGIIIGFSIAGQIFYSMTLENLMYYALIKAVGGTKKMIFSMIIVQALLAGMIGFCLGIGATLLWGAAIKGTTLAFLFPWQLLLFTGTIVLFICLFTTLLCIRKVSAADPKVLMGN
jgi:putative ABC transport system permease protein